MDRSSLPRPLPRRSPAIPLGYFEWLLVGFLLVSGAIHLFEGWSPIIAGGVMTRDEFWRVAVGTFSILLGGQVILRTPVARFSIAILFLLQIGRWVNQFAIEQPEAWLTASWQFRLQQLGLLMFWAVAVIWVLSRPWRMRRGSVHADPVDPYLR